MVAKLSGALLETLLAVGMVVATIADSMFCPTGPTLWEGE